MTRRAFPSFSTFVSMKFDLKDVKTVSHGVMDLIPLASPLPMV